MSDKKPYYAFFPYLRTSETVRVRRVELRSSLKLDGLPDETKRAVAVLAATFCLHDGSPIKDVIFTHGESSGDPAEEAAIEGALRRVQLLLAYAHTSPSHSAKPWLSAEHATIFLFRKDRMVPRVLVWPRGEDELERPLTEGGSEWFQEGFEGLRDWTAHFWVLEGCRVHPEFPYFYRNVTQDLTTTLASYLSRAHTWALGRLYRGDDDLDGATTERIFLAMQWYVASCRFAADDSEKLLSLAIALEALLRVREGDGLTERFKDAVTTLVGPVPRLDSWLEQFYRERSKIVHEGRSHKLAFFAADKQDLKELQKGKVQAPAHGMLIDYGLRIFRVCLNAIVSGAIMAADAELANLFVPDTERLVGIAKLLGAKDKSATERLAEAAKEINKLGGEARYQGLASPDSTVTIDQLWAVCRMVMELTRDVATDLPAEVSCAIDAALRW